MLHRVCSTIIHGECGLSEPPRKFPSLNSTCERRSVNLVKCFAYRIISLVFGRWASVFVLMVIILIIRERLTRRSLWSASIATILFIVEREVRIATGPKLDGNTLHIKVLFSECTTILWLKWLTCSTGSVRPLYVVNVAWVNHRGSFLPSILRVKGDLEIWLSALFIASFPKSLEDELLFLRSWW